MVVDIKREVVVVVLGQSVRPTVFFYLDNIMYFIGDIHNLIKEMETNSIDLIYTNPPFGITKKDWDKPLDWDNLWIEIWRVLKPDGICILHCSMPFTYTLIQSQLPKYHYTWIKNNSTNFLNAKKQPLRSSEEILVYYKKKHTYNPQMTGSDKRGYIVKPQCKYYGASGTNKSKIGTYHVGNYPTNILNFPIEVRGGKTVPDELIEYFINTYSNENDLVLDMTCHNKCVGNICDRLNRFYIGIDINEIVD
jgi:DNA modification methylase